MPQAGLCDNKLLLGVENRNHVLSDLSRLVGVGCKMARYLLQSIFQARSTSSWHETVIRCGEQEGISSG